GREASWQLHSRPGRRLDGPRPPGKSTTPSIRPWLRAADRRPRRRGRSWQRKRPSEEGMVAGDQIREPPAGQGLDGEDLLDRVDELEQGDGLPRPDVDHPDAAGPLVEGALGDRYAVEHRAFADLRQADEREGADEVQAAREARERRDDLVATRPGL